MKSARHIESNVMPSYRIHSRPSGAKNVDKLTASFAAIRTKACQRDLVVDTALLAGRAFAQGKAEKELLARFHLLAKAISNHPNEAQIWGVYDWLLVPYSLWPIDFVGIAKHL